MSNHEDDFSKMLRQERLKKVEREAATTDYTAAVLTWAGIQITNNSARLEEVRAIAGIPGTMDDTAIFNLHLDARERADERALKAAEAVSKIQTILEDS